MTSTRDFASPDLHLADVAGAGPHHVLTWACSTIDRLAIATSFQSSGLVLLHMLRDIRPDLPVLFLDTGFHFAETLSFKDRIAEMWDLKVVEIRGRHGSAAAQDDLFGPRLYERDPDRCCFINKVQPLQEALDEYDGWISGLRRDQSPLRASTPLVEAQMLPRGDEILKIHPLATWSKNQVDAYLEEHDIPVHPLLEQGFASIGCHPCTRPVTASEGDRAGRWEGAAKTECGIHTFGRTQNEAEQ
ncbi:MAG TPA: phosphoadenylyl-sulfate reductase [Actinomycetota bacterium]|nr:phosphoadenylyl-sulfate reductase [Actinomycetota bacterium]